MVTYYYLRQNRVNLTNFTTHTRNRAFIFWRTDNVKLVQLFKFCFNYRYMANHGIGTDDIARFTFD